MSGSGEALPFLGSSRLLCSRPQEISVLWMVSRWTHWESVMEWGGEVFVFLPVPLVVGFYLPEPRSCLFSVVEQENLGLWMRFQEGWSINGKKLSDIFHNWFFILPNSHSFVLWVFRAVSEKAEDDDSGHVLLLLCSESLFLLKKGSDLLFPSVFPQEGDCSSPQEREHGGRHFSAWWWRGAEQVKGGETGPSLLFSLAGWRDVSLHTCGPAEACMYRLEARTLGFQATDLRMEEARRGIRSPARSGNPCIWEVVSH